MEQSETSKIKPKPGGKWRRMVYCAVGLAAAGWMLHCAVTNFIEANIRSHVSVPRGNMRSIATALEAYYADHTVYPHSRPHATGSIFYDGALTTPIAYTSSMHPDLFAPVPGDTFRFYSTGDWWILWGAGPDRDYDLPVPEPFENEVEQNYSYDRVYLVEPEPQMPLALVNATYDSTNGTVSDGDMWRVKQCGESADQPQDG